MNSGEYLCMAILQSSGVIWELQGDHNVQIMQLWGFKISVPTNIAQMGINTSPSPSRRRFTTIYLKTQGVTTNYSKL